MCSTNRRCSPQAWKGKKELNWNRLEAFFGRSPKIPWLDLLRNTRVTLRDEQGTDRPSVAGLLTFGSEPAEHLRSAWIEAACYRGTRLSSDDLVHEERFTGPVPDQIDAGVAFVMRFAAPGGERRGDAPYDLEVVDEAIVNAAAHRDYSIQGSKIRLFLFADRLELYSPGKLPNTITVEEMPYRVFTRNQLLVNFLSRIRSKRTGRVFLESRGEGVRRILEGGEAHSGPPAPVRTLRRGTPPDGLGEGSLKARPRRVRSATPNPAPHGTAAAPGTARVQDRRARSVLPPSSRIVCPADRRWPSAHGRERELTYV